MLSEMQSYIFGPGTENISAEALKRRQLIASALASQKRKFPTTLGEGLTAFGESIGDRLEQSRLDKASLAQQGKDDAAISATRALPGGYGGGGTPQRVVAPPTAAPAAAPPAAAPPAAVPGAPPPVAPVIPGGAGATDLPPTSPNLASADDPANDEIRNKIAMAALQGGGVPPANPTEAGPQAPQASSEQTPPLGGPLSDDVTTGRRNAIGGIESNVRGNPYSVVGTPTRGNYPLGRYQIMSNNLPEWSTAALGRAVTPQEFLGDEKLQDAIFDHRFGGYADKYGEEGAARAWYGGEKNMNNLNATDIHGRLTIGGYGKDYMRRRAGEPGNEERAPVRLASIDPNFSAARVGEEENPPTPTDIKPIMMAQAKAQAPTDAPASYAPPRGGPSPLTPLQPPPEQTMPHPGERPAPPDLLPLSPTQQKWRAIMNSRSASDYAKSVATQEFELEEKARQTLQTRQEADYVNRREAWERADIEKKKFDREAGDRRFKQMNDWLGSAKTQADLEEAYYKTGLPRTQAAEKARLEIEQAKRTLTKPDEHVIDGAIRQRKPGEEAYTLAPGSPQAKPTEHVINGQVWRLNPETQTYAPAPGSPGDNKVTESQSKVISQLQRALVSTSQIGKNDGVLAGFRDTQQGKVPLAGNYLISPEYQRAKSAADSWLLAVIRNDSGAVIGRDEIPQHYHIWFPVPGDSPKQIAEKAQRRRAVENGLYEGLGERKDVIDKFKADRSQRKTDKPEGETGTNKTTGKRGRVIGGHWEYDE